MSRKGSGTRPAEMDERMKSSLVGAVMEAGNQLRMGRFSKRSSYDAERRCGEQALRSLKNANPGISVWGEGECRGKSVSICPLDNARNYSRGIGQYGTMAAYILDSTPYFGALFLPECAEIMTAELGRGARSSGKRVNASERTSLKESIICCNCECLDPVIASLAISVVEVLSSNMIPWLNVGSPAYAYSALASGSIDGVIDPFHDSTHAAGYLIMKESGALVTDQGGNPYSMHSKSVIAAGESIHAELLELIQGVLEREVRRARRSYP